MVYQQSIAVGLFYSICMGALAAPSQDHINADVGFESVFTDNALKAASNGISERQDTLSLGLRAQQTNRYSNFKMGYSAEHTGFSEQSQEDANSLEGGAQWILGKDFDWFNLTLEESRQKVLTSSNATSLIGNTGDREIITITPQFRLHITPVDQLVIGANRELVKFKRVDSPDAQRDSANLQWQHSLSPNDQLSLSFTSGESAQDATAEPDYKYQIARLGYRARLNHLSYGLNMGYQKAQTRGLGDLAKPNYSLDLNYDKNQHSISLAVNSAITDTLFGDGNSNSLENSLTQDALSKNYDLINLTQASVTWSSPALWRGVRVGAQAEYANHDYYVLPDDYTNSGVSFSIAYDLSVHTRSALAFEHTAYAYKQVLGLQESQDSQENTLTWRISHQIRRDLSAEFLLSNIERASDGANNQYSEQRIGLSVRYQF